MCFVVFSIHSVMDSKKIAEITYEMIPCDGQTTKDHPPPLSGIHVLVNPHPKCGQGP